MSWRSVVVAMIVVGGFGTAGGAQEPNPESELTAVVRATVRRGFTYVLRPTANIPDSIPRERQALAGTPVKGAYADGLYHAKDGTYEIYRKDSSVAVRTQRGWLPLEQFTSPLRQEVAQAFDDDDGKRWKRGNMTAGRKALNQLIQISHLSQRTNIDRLSKISLAFTEVKVGESVRIDGKTAVVYEGDLTDATAFELLQGPFAALVERGTLSLRDVSGVGRIYVQDGLVRRVVFRTLGFFTYYEETDNVQKRGMCSLEVAADLSKHGETTVELPAEVAKLFQRELK